MPKFPSFGRRKSAGNVVEEALDRPVAEPSFRVFGRTDGGSRSFDGASKFKMTELPRAKTAPHEDNMFEGLNANRGSGFSHSNTASTTDNSSRLSATSTAPSSTDASKGEDWKSPHDMPFKDIPIPRVPKSTTFSISGRTLSWGRSKSGNTPPPVPSKNSPPIEQEAKMGRARAVTASSYASTATPPKLEDRDLGLSLGGNFSDMFSSFGKRKSQILELGARMTPSRSPSRSPKPSPPKPAVRSFSSSHSNLPAPLHIDKIKEVEPSPYSWDSQHSRDGLIPRSSPAPIYNGERDPAPVLRKPLANNTDGLPTSRPQKPGGLADTGLKRTSAHYRRPSSSLEPRTSVDEDARQIRESVNAMRRLSELEKNGPRVRDSWALPSNGTYQAGGSAGPAMDEGSADTTPRAKRVDLSELDESVFDSTMIESANLAQRLEERAASQPSRPISQNKVMTPAQFERYKRDQERSGGAGAHGKEDEDDEEDNYDDEEDEIEKSKQLAKHRRKQEAHMSVYRQQMMKVTGDTPSVLGTLRPGGSAAQSRLSLVNPGLIDDKEEEDEEIPLAILQAHGFPSKNKPPMRSMGSNPNLRAQSFMGGADGRLPVFARNLPQDPYFGAGIAYPTNRESMGFGGGARSVTGAPARAVPGGLVGVIASEERSRAMRRGGSPSALGGFKPPPANGFDGMGMPPNFQPNMMNGMAPMDPMMLSPGDQAQLQMSQQMQQFMQMQMQFMQMITPGPGTPPNGNTPQQPPSEFPQPGGAPGPQLRPGSSQQRPMTMLETNTAPWIPQGGLFAPSVQGQGGYAPSIAPSERSNVGMPGRYRPVSHVVVSDNKSRASVEVGSQAWENKNKPTIRVVKKPENPSDEDDDEGWEEMAKKREKKKSMWRTKKDNNELRDMLSYT